MRARDLKRLRLRAPAAQGAISSWTRLLGVSVVLVLAIACDLTGDAPAAAPEPDEEASAPTAAPTPEQQANGCERDFATGTQSLTVESEGEERSYVLHVPATYDRERAHPLVLNFHGAGGSGQEQAEYSQMAAVADAAGFIGVAPDANPFIQTWERSLNGGADGLFVRDLVRELATMVCIDANQIYAIGFSDGASFVNRLACSGFRFAGIGLVAGGSGDAPCPDGVPTPVIGFHGTADPILAYDLVDAEGWAAGWAGRDGCEDVPAIEEPGPEVTIIRYVGCEETPVVFYRINEGGHTWPGGDIISDQIGPTTQAVDATREIARFFGLAS